MEYILLISRLTIELEWYQCKDRQIETWSKIETPEINPHTDGELISDKGAKIFV